MRDHISSHLSIKYVKRGREIDGEGEEGDLMAGTRCVLCIL